MSRLFARAKHLEDLTLEEQNTLPYSELATLRKDAYRRRMARIKMPDVIQAWAERMGKRFGPRVYMHRIREINGVQLDPELFVFDWPTALMILRWGQEPAHWPAQFTQDDLGRAIELEDGMKGHASLRPAAGLEIIRPADVFVDPRTA